MHSQGGNDRMGWQLEAEHDAAMAAARRGRPNAAGIALRVLGAIVVWLMAGALLWMRMLLPWGTANCDFEQNSLCDKSTLDLAMTIPAVAAPVAALVGTWGAFSRRPGVAPLAWVFAVGLVFVTVLVTMSIAN